MAVFAADAIFGRHRGRLARGAVAAEAHLRLGGIADAQIARDELAAIVIQDRPGAAVRAAGGRGFLPAHQLVLADDGPIRSEEHTSELQSLMRISYAVFCLKKKITETNIQTYNFMQITIYCE